MVTWAGTKFSVGCTKQILCEQSCKDRMTSSFERSDYPENMEKDSNLTKEYISAYNSGERHAICSIKSNGFWHGKKVGERVEFKDGQSMEFCNDNCRTAYGQECQNDKENSYTVRFYHSFARVFHNCGMFTFGAMWYAREVIDDTIDKVKEIGEAIKNSSVIINNKLIDVKSDFKEWMGSENKREKRNAPDAIDHEKWLPYLVSKNSTDPDLFTWLNPYNYTQFEIEANKFNSTVNNFNFGNLTTSA